MMQKYRKVIGRLTDCSSPDARSRGAPGLGPVAHAHRLNERRSSRHSFENSLQSFDHISKTRPSSKALHTTFMTSPKARVNTNPNLNFKINREEIRLLKGSNRLKDSKSSDNIYSRFGSQPRNAMDGKRVATSPDQTLRPTYTDRLEATGEVSAYRDISGRPSIDTKKRSNDSCFVFRELCNLRTLSNSFLTSLNNDLFLLKNTIDNERKLTLNFIEQATSMLQELKNTTLAALEDRFAPTINYLQSSSVKVTHYRDSIDKVIANFDQGENHSSYLFMLLGDLQLESGSFKIPVFDEERRESAKHQFFKLLKEVATPAPLETKIASVDIYNQEIMNFRRRLSAASKTASGVSTESASKDRLLTMPSSLSLNQQADIQDLLTSGSTDFPKCPSSNQYTDRHPKQAIVDPESPFVLKKDLISLKNMKLAINENEKSLRKLITNSAVGKSSVVQDFAIDLNIHESTVDGGAFSYSSVLGDKSSLRGLDTTPRENSEAPSEISRLLMKKSDR